MNAKEENICRLCLNVAENEIELIDGITREMFNVLLMKVNLDISENPIVCRECAEITRKSYYFKLACIDTEKLISSFAAGRDGTFKLEDVYREIKDVKPVIGEDLSICRFCMNPIQGNDVVPITSDSTYLTILPALMQELDLNVTKDPIICTTCKENLRCYLEFIRNSLDVEEKIRAYCQTGGTNSLGKVNLRDVLENSFDKCTGLVKQEADAYGFKVFDKLMNVEETKIKDEVRLITNNESIKNEVLDIKPEEPDPIKLNGTRMYKCEACTYETKERGYLRRHMITHKAPSELKMHKCTTCTFETKYRKSLLTHMLRHKNAWERKTYKCTMCSHESSQKRYLDAHMLKHKDASEVEMFKCTLCAYGTKWKHNIGSHMLIHKVEVDMHRCPVCPFETKRRSGLNRHIFLKHFT